MPASRRGTSSKWAAARAATWWSWARRFPQAQVTGVDLSATMHDLARRKTAGFGPRVQLLHQAYTAPLSDPPGYDLVLFSYALSMFNPGYDTALAAARRDLVPGGLIAVVDFHDSRFGFFERWMGMNHVRMNGQLRPLLQSLFTPTTDRLCPAYAGTWRYLRFARPQGMISFVSCKQAPRRFQIRPNSRVAGKKAIPCLFQNPFEPGRL